MKNHASEKELWLVFNKKATGKPVLAYDDAVEEALCFGWIDGIIKSIDEETYARKFTPRRKNSIWSDTNIRRVKKLLAEKKMHESGLRHITPELLIRKPEPPRGSTSTELPGFIKKAFSREAGVLQFFNSLAPSHRKNYIAWISAAKQEKTRDNRIAEAVSLLKNKQKLGLK